MSLASFLIDTIPTVTVVPAGGAGTEDSTFKAVSNSSYSTSLVCTSDADFKTRRSFEASIKPAKPLAGAPNGYSQARNLVLYRQPLVLDNGETTVDTWRLELSRDIETDTAELQQMLDALIQTVTSSDFADFWFEQVIQ